MQERWDHRADLAEQAVMERHGGRLWGIPRTTLAVVAWPPSTKDKLYYQWHYWWQAHFIDCQVDATLRRNTRMRLGMIRRTIRGMRLRNFGRLTRNRYYDDKAWLALALERVDALDRYGRVRYRGSLEEDVFDGVDSLTGVMPWRVGETFYNVPTNGPVAILAARTGRLELAEQLTDWVHEKLIDPDGLVMDGIRMRLSGPETVTDIHAYCQGVMLAANLELARAQRRAAGIDMDAVNEVGMASITRVQHLVDAIDRHMTNDAGSLDWRARGGDDGLFKGILARYLALVATSLPGEDASVATTRRVARRLVLRSAESVWRYRLEVDGLPVFPASWGGDAVLPQAGGLVGAALSGSAAAAEIPERDLSVQLSGWMLMEAAASVSARP
ncbi:MAG: glycoside hydrolase family 76 protein [Mycobacteriaceae bacterium]|uniref:glycoside hydrolase family 76 protein n=1 Tax=Corynebacterium sp. TaxID=1720 RepID=UPI003F947103